MIIEAHRSPSIGGSHEITAINIGILITFKILHGKIFKIVDFWVRNEYEELFLFSEHQKFRKFEILEFENAMFKNSNSN